MGDGVDLEGAATDQEASGLLHAAIARLPPLQRTLLTLYHLEECRSRDLADHRPCRGPIKSHLFRSRKRLRALLEPSLGVFAA